MSVITSYLSQAVQWATASAQHSLAALVALFAIYVVYVLSASPHASLPGPFLARFTDLWMARQAMRGDRSLVIHEEHKKHGTFVRLGPTHVSIADPTALNSVYGHSTGTTKSEFYDAFAAPNFPRGLFNTRSRPEHTRKRKMVSHTFAPKNVQAFEPFIRREVETLCGRFDEFAKAAKEKGEEWFTLDALDWLNFYAFDTIASLAFGSVFGMMEQGRDDADVVFENADGSTRVETVPAVRIINERGEYSATMGYVPVYLRPLAARIPWFANRLKSVKRLTGIAVAKVNQRLKEGSERDDLLSRLSSGKDESGQPMGKEELTSEALTQLIAGSDTTSNTSAALLYHVMTHPEVKEKLVKELDESLKSVDVGDVPVGTDVAELPYFNAVVSESLRYHSTSSMGLPRLVPEGGAVICGKHFPAGTTLSVPAYTIHRNQSVWGSDADSYNPDRWLATKDARANFERAFVPFSIGPRACVGRNVALLELQLLLSTLFRRYDFELARPGQEMNTIEGFLRKPVALPVKIKRRQ
ncbi:cytochrome P450 [Microstroma glucosiphilum]|uniref:Cytochrome P450 n=1 Tax=Pseudomicrostroma glucosiphilum TaxID=1684307 RepID=A0A316UCN3_9BASI|nr:cytochrome P450 [Pseudomicrostroma glucosiphilum]PWN22638.1 cytochrome P450 [Pseudomicrostroma glucosiphilum]